MWRDFEYVPLAQKKENARKALAKLKKMKPDARPVMITGNKIAKTWWGNAWNNNLNAYADYANRIGRGSAYVKNGFVIDLQIETGKVTAIVVGSRSEPYHIKIIIKTLPETKWKKITDTCGHSIANIEQLVCGEFPAALATLFTQKDAGLFPAPKEIEFSCSCPDWAGMCKHVAAALYGIGARFDEDPMLFFKLRGIDVKALIKKSIDAKMENMLKNSAKKTKRVMRDADISGLFGI